MNFNPRIILEFLWFVAFIASLAAGIHQTAQEGFHKSYLFFIICCLSLAMYLFRRKQRKQEKNSE
jgi:hypothetical protein